MAASITSVTKAGPKAWKYVWTGTSPFSVYQDGILLDGTTTTDTSRVVTNDDDNEPPVLEVLDSTESDPWNLQYSPRGIIQFHGDSNAAYYVIQEYSGGAWTDRQMLRETGAGYYQHQTGVLTDASSAQWRVVPYDKNDNAGTDREFDWTVTRYPERPSVTLSYSSGTGQVTVASA